MYQFIHIELYAKIVSEKAITRRQTENANGRKKSGTKSLLTVTEVIDEAVRKQDNCFHVDEKQVPKHIFGVTLDEVEKIALESVDCFKDPKGRKLRIDTPILLAGVASYPRDEYDRNRKGYEKWLSDNINFLKLEYGQNLKNITEHQDEAHPHIHFYAVSSTGRAKDIHAGHIQEKKAIALSLTTSSKGAMHYYKQGMRDFQDRYYIGVGMPSGMTKTGAHKLRLTRSEKVAREKDAKSMAGRLIDINTSDVQVADSLQKLYDDKVAAAEQEKNLIIANAQAEATELVKKGQSIIDIAFNKAKKYSDEINSWGKNIIENMRRLANAEKKVLQLTQELSSIKTERDFFAEQYAILKKANTQGRQYK